MKVAPCDVLGAEVAGLAVQDVGADDVAALRALLAEHGVLVFRDQDVDDAGFLTFLRAFGPLAFSTGETPVDGYPDLNVITNVGRDRPPRSSFHVDTSYVRMPPAYTALRAVQVPVQGGETVFSDQRRAWETLPDRVRADLADRTVTHVVTGLDLGPDDESRAEHPLARPHPLSGRPSLYLSTVERCVAVAGMSADEAHDLITYLLAHSTREDNLLRHRWAPGDVVMWDNACVLHKADHTGVVGDRVMHRGMVAGYS